MQARKQPQFRHVLAALLLGITSLLVGASASADPLCEYPTDASAAVYGCLDPCLLESVTICDPGCVSLDAGSSFVPICPDGPICFLVGTTSHGNPCDPCSGLLLGAGTLTAHELPPIICEIRPGVRELNIRWLDTHDAQRWTVGTRRAPSGPWTYRTVRGEEMQAVMGRLRADTVHEVRMRGVLRDGTRTPWSSSHFAAPFGAIAGPTPPPVFPPIDLYPPINDGIVHVRSNDTSTATVFLPHPPSPRRWTIGYRRVGVSGFTYVTAAGAATEHLLTGLLADTLYEAKVRAVMHDGTRGDFSPVTVFRTVGLDEFFVDPGPVPPVIDFLPGISCAATVTTVGNASVVNWAQVDPPPARWKLTFQRSLAHAPVVRQVNGNVTETIIHGLTSSFRLELKQVGPGSSGDSCTHVQLGP